ncbi:MAG TPA: phosphoenolpyruvate--protein phosphotransferase [Deltaproteobacteria bacterium]|nr:phosphoenolpyruvate--protein phosphotransferase [Deltaproteobacteria bacterium]HDZ89123.1 phosphoenolpyruvate--protein phosphotransferase [Deltaproteobacteria bacterium]
MTTGPATGERELRGVAVYPDIVIGKAHLIDRSSVKIQYQCFVHDEDVDREVARFKEAVKTVEKEFTSLKENMPDRVRDQSFILDSHLMILRDGMLYDSTIEAISEERINAEWALKKSLEEIGEVFEEIDDEYISNRISDVENVTDRLLRTLSGDTGHCLGEINQRVIIVAHDLSPADTTELNTAWVMGFITDVGGKTSHTAIMAQALEIPAVVGLETATSLVKDGDLLIVDGSAGVVVINPDDRAIIHYQEKKLQLQAYRSSIARTSHLPAETPDGHRVAITANIEFLEEVTAAKDYGGEGIGLYRTEFLYLRGRGFPDEEELFEDYREVVEIMSPAPVSIRTLDLGGDKFASEVAISGESNPALGLRAIRFCLREPEIFKVQLRAILRASAYGNIQLMFPMISGLQELIDAKEILGQVQEELDRDKIPYDTGMEVGIMMEIPSAVTMAEVLARHVDFFSIGTNDLIQYALAIDRINEHVAYMYEPFHPAILRMIRQVVNAARDAGIKVALCGEMAGDPLCVSILLGIGIDRLSMNARAIPLIKKMVRAIPVVEARADLKKIMGLSTAKEVRAYILEKTKRMFPELEEKGYILD